MINWIGSGMEWLLSPLSGSLHHEIAPWAYWHARMMVLGWNILLPIGMLVARFFKVTPGQDWPKVLDRKFWWRAHVGLQSAGVAIATLGLCVAIGKATFSVPSAFAHYVLGCSLIVVGWFQIAGGLLRGSKGGPGAPTMRGDHYDMTGRRVVFEYAHKLLGWVAILLVIPATGLGLTIVDAPRWMPIVLGVWWILLFVAFTALQRAARCIDTYQAIWGPDPMHPGNRRNPIGWGVRRFRDDDAQRRPRNP